MVAYICVTTASYNIVVYNYRVTHIYVYIFWLLLQGGMYVFQLFDFYAGSRIVVLVALFEIIAICYIYGTYKCYICILI